MHKILPTLLLALFAILSFACSSKKDDPIPEPPALAFTVDFEGNSGALQSNEKLSISSDQENEIASVKFYIGTVLIAEDAEAPFELVLDTEQYENGNHQLRVVALSKDNKETEAVITITIANEDFLFKAVIPQGYVPQDRDARSFKKWIYLTDQQNKLIGEIHKIENGQEYKWETPEGFSGSFNLHVFTTQENAHDISRNDYSMRVYLKYPLKEFKPNDTPANTYGNMLHLNLTNDTGKQNMYTQVFYGGNAFMPIPINVYGTEQFTVKRASETEKVLVLQQPALSFYQYGDYRYHLVSGATGSTIDLVYNNGMTPQENAITLPSNITSASAFSVWNIDGNYIEVPGYYIGARDKPTYLSPSNNEGSVTHVGASFFTNGSHYNILKPASATANVFEPPLHRTAATLINKTTFSLQNSGDADYFTAAWVTDMTTSLSFVVQGPFENTIIERPELPTALKEHYPNLANVSAKLSEASSTNYANINGYSDYLASILPSLRDGWFIDKKEFLLMTGGYSRQWISVSSNGQRIENRMDHSRFSSIEPSVLENR